jgi:hypothetical protein
VLCGGIRIFNGGVLPWAKREGYKFQSPLVFLCGLQSAADAARFCGWVLPVTAVSRVHDYADYPGMARRELDSKNILQPALCGLPVKGLLTRQASHFIPPWCGWRK